MNKTIIKSKETKKRLSFIIYFLLLVLVLSGCGDPHRYRTTRYYTPDWSPDGTHIACIEETYEFDRIDNPGVLDPRGDFNESTTRKLIVYDIDKAESKAYNYGGYYPFDLDWYPGTDILLSDGSENLKILRMSGNQYVSTDSMKIADSKGILRARWNYDRSMIAVGFREDTAIWIVNSSGNFIEKLESMTPNSFVWKYSDNIIFFKYTDNLVQKINIYKVYDFNTKKYNVYRINGDLSGMVLDWLDENDIIIYANLLDISDSSTRSFNNYPYSQLNSERTKLIGLFGYDMKLLNIQTQEERIIINSIDEQRID